jgi:hypothetical protein
LILGPDKCASVTIADGIWVEMTSPGSSSCSALVFCYVSIDIAA